MLRELLPVKEFIGDWEITVLALAYHDIIYNVLEQDNEERSAELGMRRLKDTGIGTERIALFHEMIITTKSHDSDADTDVSYFADADMSVFRKVGR